MSPGANAPQLVEDLGKHALTLAGAEGLTLIECPENTIRKPKLIIKLRTYMERNEYWKKPDRPTVVYLEPVGAGVGSFEAGRNSRMLRPASFNI